jgi:hypothetical protein
LLTLAEIGPATFGAWRLACRDPNGMRYFDTSLEGFWRSFYVAILAAPFTGLLIYFNLTGTGVKVAGDWFHILAGETIGYVIGWTAFPLAMFYLSEAIGRRDKYLGFIVAYNWSTVVQLAVILPPAFIYWLGVLPHLPAVLLLAAGNIALLLYEWFIVRTALSLPGLAAAGIVALDQVVIAYFIQWATDSMVQVS